MHTHKAHAQKPPLIYANTGLSTRILTHSNGQIHRNKGGMVQLTHSSVCIMVLESRIRYGSVCAMFREKLHCQIKIKKIRIIYLTTSNSTNKYNRVNIQNEINRDFQVF